MRGNRLLSISLILLFLFSSCSAWRTPRSAAYSKTETPFSHLTVVLDPGHGGKDGGAQTMSGQKMHEKFVALSTSLMVRDYLKQKGFRVLLTRNEDRFIPLQKRSFFSNQNNADIFVSIHYNGAPSFQAHGVEVYLYKDGDPLRIRNSEKLAQHVLSRLIETTEAKNRGVKHGNFSVIRNTTSPAILVEAGFLTHGGEALKIRSPSYQSKIALGIAKGIRDYFSEIQ